MGSQNIKGDEMDALNSSEAVYGFAAWLTTRDEVIRIGGSENCAPIAELVKKFCEINNFQPISENWPRDLKFPK